MTSNVPFTQLAALPGLKTFGDVADGAQGFEDHHALHSRCPASTRGAADSVCPQIGQK